MSITFTDSFCGFGGSSRGLTEAGLELVWAANHWDRAIEVHAANFPKADHWQGDLSGFDMRRMPKADVAWLSPECTWHSPAGGRKRVRATQLDLFDDYVPNDAGERSRATMWDVVRAAEAKGYKIVVVENVVEVTSWPSFDAWLHAMELNGYDVQIVCVSAAHVGGEGNPHAPQWRDRIYFVFSKKGIAMPVIENRPLAWCSQCEGVVESRQSWKREDRRRIGKYGPQYNYVCAAGKHAPTVVEPFVLPAAAAIDWSDLGTKIRDRPKREFFADKAKTQSLGMHHLAPATMRRIRIGFKQFSQPVIAAAAGQTYDAATATPDNPRPTYRVWPVDGAPLNTRSGTPGDALAVPFVDVARANNRARGVDEPLAPLTTGRNHGVVTPPIIVAGYDHKGGDERRVKPALATPLGTVVANGRGHHQLVVPQPFIAEIRGTGTARTLLDDALGAVTAGGNHHGLTIPDGFIVKNHGGLDYAHPEHMVKSPTEPLPTLVARSNTSLVIPYRRGKAALAGAAPLPTQTTSNTTALVVPEWDDDELDEAVLEAQYRMLGPREHLSAQRFPDDYIVLGNKGEQTQGAGNAVAVNVAHWLGTIIIYALTAHVARSERAA